MKRLFLFTIFCLGMIFLLCFITFNTNIGRIDINNEMSADQIITVDHGLEKLLLTEAIFRVKKGFEDVNARDLCEEVGITLECKRQISPFDFYYVVFGGDYRGFIFVDEHDKIHNVLVARQFPTIEEAKQCVKFYDDLGLDVLLTNVLEHGFNQNWRTCGNSRGFWHRLFTLKDGVLILKEPYPLNTALPEYYYFSDAEWEFACKDWGGFIILPIDKT